MTAAVIAARDCDWYAELDRLLARWSAAVEGGHTSHEAIRDQIVAYCAAPTAASVDDAPMGWKTPAEQRCYSRGYISGRKKGREDAIDAGMDSTISAGANPLIYIEKPSDISEDSASINLRELLERAAQIAESHCQCDDSDMQESVDFALKSRATRIRGLGGKT